MVYIFFLPLKGHVIGSADSYNQFLPLRVFYSHVLKDGEFPLWYPYQALGLPFLGIVQTGALYPLNLFLYKFFDPYWAYNINIFIHFVLAQFFAFLYADYIYKKIGLGRVFSFFSGFIFGLSGFVVSHVDFVPLQNSVPYLPLSLLFLNKLVDNWKGFKDSLRVNFVWIWGLSICLGYQFLAGYPQAFLYTFIFLFLFLLFSNYRLLWVLFLSLVLSVPMIFLFAYEVLSLSNISVRSHINFETYNQGSLPIYALLNQVIPFIFGGSVNNPNYYGPSTGTISFEFISYISLLALPLTVFCYVKVVFNNHLRGYLGILALLGIIVFVLALGKYNLILHYLLFDIPFYSKVRIVARHLMELNLIQAVFIPVSINYILGNLREFFRFIKIAFFTYVFIFFSSTWFFTNPEVGKNLSKLTINSYDLYFPLVLGILSFMIIIFYNFFRNFVTFFLIKKTDIVIILFTIFFLDSWFTFYNINPSYASGWWGKRENIESYLKHIEKLDSNYRICYFTGFPLLFPGVKNKSMLNYYEPVIPFDFVQFFNIWMNGSFIHPHDYFLIVNNSILTAFSVKYLFINQEFNRNYNKYISVNSLRSFDFRSIDYQTLDFSNIKESFKDLKDSQSVKFDFINDTFSLRNNSKLIVSFRTGVQNRIFVICFRAKVSKVGLMYKYRKLIFSLTDGLGIELKDRNNNSLSYYFVNDYYLGKDEWVYCLVPMLINTDSDNDFISLRLYIYPLNSFTKIYEIKDLRVFSFPLKAPNFVDNTIRDAYVYSNSFMNGDLYINYQALPMVFSPEKLIFCRSIDEIKYYFWTLKFNPIDTALISGIDKLIFDKSFSKPFSKAKVEIVNKKSNYVSVLYESEGDSLIVFNDMYYRGWKAQLNGQNLTIFRINGFSKGVVVSKGKGEIRFYYEPFPLWVLSVNIILIYLYLVIFVILFWLRRNVERNKLQRDY
ncbi:MAG: hypothetical protein N2169_00360 [bacterium]|nr:hypothetical protein [bacterium]